MELAASVIICKRATPGRIRRLNPSSAPIRRLHVDIRRRHGLRSEWLHGGGGGARFEDLLGESGPHSDDVV